MPLVGVIHFAPRALYELDLNVFQSRDLGTLQHIVYLCVETSIRIECREDKTRFRHREHSVFVLLMSHTNQAASTYVFLDERVQTIDWILMTVVCIYKDGAYS